MASLMELIIVQQQVLKIDGSEDERKNRQLNAQFGMNASLSMIGGMINNAGRDIFFCTNDSSVDENR